MFEAHPVPQNVTEFQFHLVGDMTIKQFIYLAVGLGSAYLVFALLWNKFPIIATPIILILAGSGAALAFIPIQDRPLDHWLGAYFRAIFQPTKRSYKSKILTKEDPLFKSRLQVFLNTRRRSVGNTIQAVTKAKGAPFSFSVQSMMQPSTPQQPVITPLASPQTKVSTNQITPVQQSLNQAKSAGTNLSAVSQPAAATSLPVKTAAAPSPAVQPNSTPIAAPIQLSTPSITILEPEKQNSVPSQDLSMTGVHQMTVQATPQPLSVANSSQSTILGTAEASGISLPQQKSVPVDANPLPKTTRQGSTPSLQMSNPVIIKPAAVYTIPTASIPASSPVITPNQKPLQTPTTIPSLVQTVNRVETGIPVSMQAQSNLPQPVVRSSETGSKESEMPSEADLIQTIELAKQVHTVQQKILQTEQQIGQIRSQAAAQDANPKQYLNQFHQLLGELQNLNQQAANLSQQVAQITNEPMRLPSLQADLVVKAKSIPTITLTSIANVINGIVTDSAGNYLEGAIILAHDKSGIPVRALKTNKLGQFVAATPLNNGVYTITIEKEELVFDTIEIELKGTLLKPILITAKPVAGGVAHG